MATNISSVASTQSAYTYTPAQARTQQAEQPHSASDSIKLSQSAQIILLSRQGHSAKQIALSLSVPVTTVNKTLRVVAPAATPAPAAPPAK